ncbi:MAG: RsmB/NOP family class I SAM-dependent RNA methyltransferase, partial [Alphaproteobacteria bacterium]
MSGEGSSRGAALELLQAVLRHRRPLDEAMDDLPALAALSGRDRAFVRCLVATTLRHLGVIDALVDRCLEHPLPSKRSEILGILRLGTAQSLFLDIPAHAAVDTMVNLAARTEGGAYKGLVNAVLRRLAREGREIMADLDAAWSNTPPWLWQSWSSVWGETVCRRIAEANQKEAPLDLTVRGEADGWAERLKAQVLPTGSLRLPSGGAPVSELPGYDEGGWWVQDAAASLPVHLFGELRGRNVIDLCAAPGGKTAQMAAAGANVTAVDRSPRRLKRLSDNLARLGLSATTVVADATSWRPAVLADAVLLDAPCSATGTIRRHPDVPHLKTSDDVNRMRQLQAALLAQAATMVRSGGMLIYCVCSLQPEER